MKKICFVLAYIIILIFSSWSQESGENLVDIFISNFKKATPEIKLQVLKDAADMGISGMGALYLEAIDFVVANSSFLDTNLVYRNISTSAVDKIYKEKYDKAINSLWNLFKVDTNTHVRITILKCLADIAAGDAKTINNINLWLDSQNNVYKTGQTPDLQVLSASMDTLAVFADPTSFPYIFRVLTLKYTEAILSKADESLKLLKGDPKQLYTGVIRSGTFTEKKAAITKVLADKTFTDSDKCEMAEFALNMALYSSLNTEEEKTLARETRYMVVNFLGNKKWSNSTQLIIDHFNRTITELDRGIASKNYIVDAIKALGSMQNREAAKRLTLYLDLVNSFTENGKAYDEQLVLAAIDSLGMLGDQVASGTLLYTKYLNYSDTVKKAATSAIKNLK